MKIQVRTPATSANLGPGFDALGMAHGLYDDLVVEFSTVAPGGEPLTEVAVSGQGAGQVPLDDTHLVVQAIRTTIARAGGEQPNLALTCNNNIPHGRGLGSSAAAVVSGITAALAYLDGPERYSRQAALELSTEFEGHPDNAAPAIFGGATVAWLDDACEPGGEVGAAVGSPDGIGVSQIPTNSPKPQAAKIPVHDQIAATLLIPEVTLSTKTARAALPAEVPHRDAAFNAARAALNVVALSAQPQLLFAATEDRLHQPYRAAQMPESTRVLRALRQRGFAATISGAGPTVLVLCERHQLPQLDEALLEVIGVSGDISGSDDGGMSGLSGPKSAPWQVIRPELDEKGAQARRII
ncbi:MAG: homoserine kinase [Cellulomonadaceae bacterium]|jgi:homoserine kinase|nr:homoserine kinase [Cellulomonadaceae bacterium]